MPTRIILIRHGETPLNAKKIYCGATDTGLNGTGKKQARRLMRALRKEDIRRVYASDLKRAAGFARLVFGKKSIKKIPGLREMRLGIFEGMSHERIMKKYPDLYRRWLSDPAAITVPKAEKFRNFQKRVLGFFKKAVLANKDRTVAFVTHAGPIRVILCDTLKGKGFWDFRVGNASIHILELEEGRMRAKGLNKIFP